MKSGACTHCGANIEFSDGNLEMVCPYCRELIKTREAEEHLQELQRGGGCATAFLASFMYSTDLKSIYPVKICQNLLFRAKFKEIWQKPG